MAAEEIDLSLSLLELRGDASVVGGQTFDSMTGGYIRLDLNEDGTGLEQLALANDAAIVMSGNDGESGREFAGNELDLTFAPDGSLTRVAGLGNVRVVLPGARGEPGRSVTAQAFEATGNAGMDLTWARFDDEVEYREEASKGRAPRVVHSSLLRITLADVAVTSALFGGGVRFEEQGFQASGAQAQYDPINGTLQLSGTDTGGAPHVADEQIEIDSDVIDITLVGRQITASGSVTTLLYAGGSERLPGLLEAGEPVNVSSDTLDYQGRGGAAVYTGDATLWQGATAIRADQIMLDRTSADLVASGTARSRIVFDLGEAVGRAAEIRYDDVARTITYETPAWTPAVVAPTPFEAVIEAVADGLMAEAVNLCADLTELGCDDLLVRPAQLSGPQGDIRARRIEVVLGRTTTSAERLEAYGDVSANLGMRTATGDRLTYFAEDERYVMSGIATIPVTIVEECRQTSGRAMTFFKSTKRIIVDGQEEVRTKSVRGASCVATPTP
jgi:lipopolysaccharide export system protein LptA